LENVLERDVLNDPASRIAPEEAVHDWLEQKLQSRSERTIQHFHQHLALLDLRQAGYLPPATFRGFVANQRLDAALGDKLYRSCSVAQNARDNSHARERLQLDSLSGICAALHTRALLQARQ